MKDPAPADQTLHQEEWDFSRVPEREQEACFFWECCREWTDLRQALLTAQQYKHVQSVGGIALDPEVRRLVQIAGSAIVTTPWQLLTSFRRKVALEILSPSLVSMGFVDAESHSKIFEHYRALHASGSSFPPAQTYGLFRIHWQQSDGQLLADFADWLKINRPFKAQEKRGTQPQSWLRMIGAMRLLHHYTFEKAYEITSQSGEPLYGKRPSWERARKGALDAFRNRFFLDWRTLNTPPVPFSFAKRTKLIAPTS